MFAQLVNQNIELKNVKGEVTMMVRPVARVCLTNYRRGSVIILVWRVFLFLYFTAEQLS